MLFSTDDGDITDPDRDRFRLVLTPLAPLADVCCASDLLGSITGPPDADNIAFALCFASEMEFDIGPFVCLSGDAPPDSDRLTPSAVSGCDTLEGPGSESLDETTGCDESA